MQRSFGLASALCCASLLACGGKAASPCDGVSGKCTAFSAGARQNDIAAAFVTAPPNSTIAFDKGTYSFTNTLSLANVAGVTIKGAGIDKTIFDFSGVAGSGEGILANSTNMVLFTGFTARDTKGNGLKVVGSDGVTFRAVKTTWTSADGSAHGAYGLYPVQCKNVLIENSEVSGAADAGVYVGQSDHIIVRNNNVHGNVAGIEIENSSFADVRDNVVSGNTAGILVFDMPDLTVNGGHSNHVFNNTIQSNNTTNFAARGSSVSRVPGGTGAFVLAGHDVEFDHNTFIGNNAAALSVVSYAITQDPRLADPSKLLYGYGAILWPWRVYLHDNTFTGNGTDPNPLTNPDPLGLGLLLQASGAKTGGTVAATLYDGFAKPGADLAATGGTTANPMNICIASNGGATFINLHFDQFDGTNTSIFTTDKTAYASCTLPPVNAGGMQVTAP